MIIVRKTELKELMDFAVQTAVGAGNITLEYFGKAIEVRMKAEDDPVTIADKRAEQYIRERIGSRFPSHSILGEEYAQKNTGSPFKWVIDPIDGTQSFIHGVPLYAVLVAVEYEGVPAVGVVHCPPLLETASAATGLGCYHNGARCQVSKTASLGNAWAHVTDIAELQRYRPGVAERVISKVKHCRTWGDAYGYLLVATGRADAMLDPVMNEWDIAPLMPIIVEAGGRLTDLDGRPNPVGASALATNGILHDEMLDVIKSIMKH